MAEARIEGIAKRRMENLEAMIDGRVDRKTEAESSRRRK
jgi:hypothetical protein